MKKFFNIILWTITMVTLGCSGSNNEEETPIPTPPTPTHNVPSLTLQTRTDESNLVANKNVGIFMSYGSLQKSGNYLNNFQLKSDDTGSWNHSPITWKDNTTPADFYGYAPRQATLSNAYACPFSVEKDQSSEATFNSSDFIWGKLLNQNPTEQPVNLTLNHLMAKVVMNLAAGQGFTEAELLKDSPEVLLNGVCTQASVHLGTGTVTATGNIGSITPLQDQPLHYVAYIVPQKVDKTELVTVKWRDGVYTLTREMTFETGKQYSLTITLQKTEGSINISIAGWDIDNRDYGGKAY